MARAKPILPHRAAVRPIVYGSAAGSRLLLERAVQPIVEGASRGAVAIIGDAGCGKTTALRHLAALFQDRPGIVLLDEPDLDELLTEARSRLVFFTTRPGGSLKRLSVLAAYELAPWGDDECIEYLLSAHRDRCGRVMQLLKSAPDRSDLDGHPLLTIIVLDAMARFDAIHDSHAALTRFLHDGLPGRAALQLARAFALGAMLRWQGSSIGKRLRRAVHDEQMHQALAVPYVQRILATEHVLSDLMTGRSMKYASGERRLPPMLIQAIGRAIAAPDPARRALMDILASDDRRDLHSTAAGILHATRHGWRPADDTQPHLQWAWLPAARWSRLCMPDAVLASAMLDETDLSEACFDGANLQHAKLRRACLRGASLRELKAFAADFSEADLSDIRASGADLSSACLSQANLSGAMLYRANLKDADLTGANLSRATLRSAQLARAGLNGTNLTGTELRDASLPDLDLRSASLLGACLHGACLERCNLEDQRLPGIDLENANLAKALLTAAWMPRARLRGAKLHQAGLADIDLEEADLRDVDLRYASFHAGSSRSGLVGSPIACEGSKTGFYTDDYEEQGYRSPEEIRKANLRGADLRGANVFRTDFYLVDLRDAVYDDRQAEHFRRCRAILHARV